MPQTSAYGDPSRTLYLLDISSFIFRAFFAIRRLSTPSGEPTNAVYGVASMLAKLVNEAHPQFMAVAYDSKEASFREEMYPDYKANRDEAPDDLVPQFARIDQLVREMHIPSVRQAGVEADDLIASLAEKWLAADPQNEVMVVTGDKDLMQLVTERCRTWDTMAGKIYGTEQVIEKLAVRPEQVRDYLGLVGDSSDNIPGVPSIGPKTAADLLKEHGNLDAIIKAARAGKISGKKATTIVEHEKVARLSADLATVKRDLDVKADRASLAYSFRIEDGLRALLRELGFQSLLTKWEQDQGAAPAVPLAKIVSPPPAAPSASSVPAPSPAPGLQVTGGEGKFHSVLTEADLSRLLEKLERAPEFGFDVETTSLNPREAVLVGVAIALDPREGFYIPVNHRGTSIEQLPEGRVIERLRPLLENPRHKKIGQNLKYDINVMAQHGVKLDGVGADTMVAAYVIDPEGRHNLDTLARQHLGYEVLTYEQVCGKGKDQLPFDMVPIDLATRYSGEDAMIALRLWDKFKRDLERDRLMAVFSQVDLPLVQVLARMEREGVCIDTDFLAGLSREFGSELRTIEEKVASFTHGPVNLNSPKQLAVLLFDQLKLPPQGKTKTGFSTDASVLEALAPLHEVPRLLLEYREISKLKGTYVDPLPGMRDPKTGKIHASFHQTVAATGRLSSSDPNLQNIPIRTERGRKIRRAFLPCPGNELISVDYSQIELRLLASMSGDPELVRAFREGEDVHRRTASEIFNVAPAQVDDRQRGIAKAINFGLMYGKTAFGLAQELGIPRKEAQAVIDRYFERYAAVKTFLDAQIERAQETGAVTTLMGRRRPLPDIRSKNQALRANAERMAMNSPIQGTAADLMKIAMINLDEKLREGGYGAKLVIQVHDEVVLDCPKAEVREVEALVTRVMEDAGGAKAEYPEMRLSVPLTVNAGHGGNWMEI